MEVPYLVYSTTYRNAEVVADTHTCHHPMSSSTLGFKNEAFIRVAYFLWDFLCFSLSLSLSPTAPTTPSERSDGRSDPCVTTAERTNCGDWEKRRYQKNAHGKYIAL